MDRNDLRRADNLLSSWDDVVLGRAPADPALLGDEVANLITRLRALADFPEQDSARERVWHALEQHPRWKEPDVHSPAFSQNGAIAPPLALPPRVGRPAPLALPARPNRRVSPIAYAAIALLVIMALVAGYFTVVHAPQPAGPLPGVATPTPDGTPAADWPMYRGNPARTGVMAGPGPDGQPVEAWHLETQGSASQAPAIAAGVAYLQSGDGNVYALDAVTGAERWHVALGGVEGAPSVAGDTLYVGDGAGALVALDTANGAERWRFAESISAAAAPVIDNGVVFTASDAGRLFALDAATGQEKWHYDAGSATGRASAVAGGLVFFGTADGQLRVVDAATGQEHWQFASGQTSEPLRTPTVSNGVVYVNVGPTLYAFDATTGAEHWRTTFYGARPVTTAGGMLYTAGLDGNIYALDPADGSIQWTFNTGVGNATAPAPSLVGDTLYAVSGQYALYALDATTGAERWEIPLDGAEVDTGPSVANSMIYVGTKLGTFYAFGGSGVAQLMAPESSAESTVTSGEAAAGSATPAAAATLEAASPDVLWQATGGPQPLLAPAGAALNSDGNLWVVDAFNNQVQIIGPDGKYVDTWDGTSGGGEHFDFAKAGNGFDGDIAFAPDGRIYVAEAGADSHRVQVFAPDRTWLSTWGDFGPDDGQFIAPESVAVDAQGNVYVKDNEQRRIQKFNPDGNFLLSIGGPNVKDGHLTNDGYITVDQQGNVLAAGWGSNEVARFAPDGTLLARWGGLGNKPGQFRTTVDVAADADGNAYVVDMDNARIQLLDPDGQALAMWSAGATPSGEKNLPYAVVLDGEGNLYVVGTAADGKSEGNIQKFRLASSPTAATTTTPATPVAAAASPWQVTGGPTPLVAPAGAAVDSDGNIWVVDAGNDQIQIIAPDGQFIEAWDGTSGGGKRFDFLKSNGGPDGDIAFGPDGRIYVVEPGSSSHGVQVFDHDRQWIATWNAFGKGDGQFIEPLSVAVDTQGNVYVEDNVQKRVQKFAPDGTFLLAFGGAGSAGGELADAAYITVDRQGNVVVPVQNKGRIVIFASDGTRRAEWGGFGDAPGEFRQPIDVAVDDFGNVYVTDMDNARIQLLDEEGHPLAVWSAGATPSGKQNIPFTMALDGEGNLYVVGTAADGKSEGNVQKFRVVPSLVPVTIATPAP